MDMNEESVWARVRRKLAERDHKLILSLLKQDPNCQKFLKKYPLHEILFLRLPNSVELMCAGVNRWQSVFLPQLNTHAIEIQIVFLTEGKPTVLPLHSQERVFLLAHEWAHIQRGHCGDEARQRCNCYRNCQDTSPAPRTSCLLEELEADLDARRLLKDADIELDPYIIKWSKRLVEFAVGCPACFAAVMRGQCPPTKEVKALLVPVAKEFGVPRDDVMRIWIEAIKEYELLSL